MVRLLSRIELAVGIALLAIITLLIFAASVMRFSGHPVIWSVDLAQLLFIWLSFIGASRAMRERAHLGVDYLVRLLGHRHRLALETGLAVMLLAFLAVLAVEGSKLTLLNLQRQFGDSGLPYALVTIAVPVGCVILALSILANLHEAWTAHASSRTLIFARSDTEAAAPRSDF